MNKFQRQTTTFVGGTININGVDVEVGEQPVQIIMELESADDDVEDLWAVRFYGPHPVTVHVDGCDLHPHPDARATNAEFMAWLVENGSPNPLIQGFVPEAVAKYAEIIIADADKLRKQSGENPLVNPEAWLSVAKDALDAINTNYRGK